jgi:hypothetical protein
MLNDLTVSFSKNERGFSNVELYSSSIEKNTIPRGGDEF